MNTIIKKEYTEFESSHTNVYNIYFHVFCGFVFMGVLCLFMRDSNIFAFLYSLLIFLTIENTLVSLIILVGLFIIIKQLSRFNFSIMNMFFLVVLFYLLPDVSHYLTNESHVLDVDNLTVLSGFIHFFYLLPFSLLNLLNLNSFLLKST